MEKERRNFETIISSAICTVFVRRIVIRLLTESIMALINMINFSFIFYIIKIA